MDVALVHDYLREYGGAERVVETLHELWPEAPLYTSFVDWEALGNQAYRFRNWDIRTSPIADNWLIKKFHSPLRFLAPWIWKSVDVSGYDVVISSSGWFMCRGITMNLSLRDRSYGEAISEIATSSRRGGTPRNDMKPLHICYIHHPPRNLYGYATGRREMNFATTLVRVYATLVNFFLRKYDWDTAQRVDYFIANSKETARRVEKFYRRESDVIYPPVEIETRDKRISKESVLPLQDTLLRKPRKYFLSVGRLTYSKRVDVAIEACNKLKLPLKVVGVGKEEKYLRSIAGPTIEFLGSVADDKLDDLYAGAKALIFCALDEDFGMVPVEAMARGVPVVALAQGGVLETVVDGNPSASSDKTQDKSSGRRTGILFFEPTTESLIKAIKRFNNLPISSKDCIKRAKKFSKERYKKELKKFVETKFRDYN